MKIKKLTILAVVVLVAGLMSFGVPTAQAATPSCGDTLTSSTVFDMDLDCNTLTGDSGPNVRPWPTAVDALTIGADNVTINLNGYSLIGPASFGAVGGGACPAGFAGTSNGTIGIRVDGFDNINILNGTIRGFEIGMMVKNAAGVRINNIEAFNNAFNALSAGDFDGILASAKGGVPDLNVNRVYFHDNRNDHIGVSADSSLSLLNSKLVDGCASGIFAAPLAFGGFPGGTPQANVDIRNSTFEDNFRSAVNFWGSTGSVENTFIKGNNTAPAIATDFGQISLVNLDGGDIFIRCNVIRESPDALDRAIAFSGSIAATTVEITRNLFFDNLVGIHFRLDGGVVTVDIHKNTFDMITTDFDLPGDNWTVDADKNFYGGSAPTISNTGAGNTITTAAVLKSAQHCRGAARY